jgi:hypothetical protein
MPCAHRCFSGACSKEGDEASVVLTLLPPCLRVVRNESTTLDLLQCAESNVWQTCVRREVLCESECVARKHGSAKARADTHRPASPPTTTNAGARERATRRADLTKSEKGGVRSIVGCTESGTYPRQSARKRGAGRGGPTIQPQEIMVTWKDTHTTFCGCGKG